jgi:ferredoxin-thioredoxin reductase catalytic chain
LTTLSEIRKRAESDARTNGSYLNPDEEYLNTLFQGLKDNIERYGYPSCPCRIASGVFEVDRDILCPCDYRDPDVKEYGACYCGLYVNEEISSGKKKAESIPERRPQEKQLKALGLGSEETLTISTDEYSETTRKLYYCKQCGYVVFREEPPYICPICKAGREMFEEIIPKTGYITRKTA